MLKITKKPGNLCFPLVVVPRSSRNMVVGCHDGALKLKITAPPVEGKANRQCVEFLSKILKLPKASIKIVAGTASKRKTVCITFPEDPDGKAELDRVMALLQTL